MKDIENNDRKFSLTPILIPIDPDSFWQQIRMIIREEITSLSKAANCNSSLFETPGLNNKPLYKIAEVCQIFQVTKPTVYEWIKTGHLKPLKIRSRVFFLGYEIHKMLSLKS